MAAPFMLVNARRIITWVLFGAVLAGFLYLALVPNVGRDIFGFLPSLLRRWCGANDDLNNALGAGVIAFLALRLSGALPPRQTICRLGGVFGLVAVLEIAQLWIPGRFSSLRDVLAGWGGILAAWLFSRCMERRSRAPQTRPLDSGGR